jgi:phage recombination protein Bet
MTTERALVAAPAAGLTSNDMLRGLHTVRNVLAPDLSDDELKLFAMVATRSGLDPFAKQVYAVKRQGRVTFQTGIDGYRSIAARTGLYDGQDEPEYGATCECGDGRPAGHPESATVRVYRKGVGRAIAATAFWHEYKPEAGASGRQDAMWVRMPRVMLAKVAEALALRKAFPYDPENRMGIGADLYTADEMAQADVVRPAPQPSARERIAQRAAAIVVPAPEEPEELFGEAVEVVEEAAPAAAPAAPSTGLSAPALAAIARQAGKTKGQIAVAIGAIGKPVPSPVDVSAAVLALTDEERGRLADELNLSWRDAA